MNIALIQAPDPPQLLEGPRGTLHESRLFPDYDLLCLDAYLRAHTGHQSRFMDTRLFNDLEQELGRALESFSSDVALVSTDVLSLGSTAAVLDICKRFNQDLITVVSGPFPTRHPEEAARLPRADFGLAGDPEPILRELLESLGLPQRLRRVPGLILSGEPPPEPRWAASMRGFSPADWQGVLWTNYSKDAGSGEIRVPCRLTRGHTGLRCDAPWPGVAEPLRQWSSERLAQSFQRAPPTGIHDLFLADPPGIWTAERLAEWCGALRRANSIQPWSFQALPAVFNDRLIEDMQHTQCKVVEFVIPATDAAELNSYGCNLGALDLAACVVRLQDAGIEPVVRFWIGGPGAKPNEDCRVLQWLRDLNYIDYTLEPFPCHPDSGLFRNRKIPENTPELEDWIHWARDPWTMARPVPLWGGEKARKSIEATMQSINARIQHSPRRLFHQVLGRLSRQHFIRRIENASMRLLAPAGNPQEWH